MDKTGTLNIDDPTKETTLDGTLLAQSESQNPFGDATATIENAGLSTGDRATVSPGISGVVNGRSALLIVSAHAATTLNRAATRALTPADTSNPRSSNAREKKGTSERGQTTGRGKRTIVKKDIGAKKR